VGDPAIDRPCGGLFHARQTREVAAVSDYIVPSQHYLDGTPLAQLNKKVYPMRRLRFKLATIIWLLTLAAVLIGLGYRIHSLEGQVAQLSDELSTLKAVQISKQLNSKTVERGMKADQLEQQRGIEKQFKNLDIPAPERRPDAPGKGLP
jgi:hypothetical protein